MMKSGYARIVLAMLLTGLLAAAAGVALGWPACSQGRTHVGIYFDLTEAFNRAMASESGDAKNYGTSLSEQYLKQIAVGTEFLVKTNLELIRLQQELIDLLKQQKAGKGAAAGAQAKEKRP